MWGLGVCARELLSNRHLRHMFRARATGLQCSFHRAMRNDSQPLLMPPPMRACLPVPACVPLIMWFDYRVMDLCSATQHFPLTCRDKGSDGFCHLPLALVADILVDDRLATGKDGEVMVFWAAVSWLEADRSRLGRADEVRAPQRTYSCGGSFNKYTVLYVSFQRYNPFRETVGQFRFGT